MIIFELRKKIHSSKTTNELVKAMEWQGQSYGMTRSKHSNEEIKDHQWRNEDITAISF